MSVALSTLLLFLVGMLSSAINAVAGGGTLLAFPVQLALGATTLQANATSSAALWLGGLSSALGYSEQLKKTGAHLRPLLVPSALGSLVGALLLISTSEHIFARVVPLLVLLATVLLALGPYLKPKEPQRRIPPWLGAVLQFLICVYGGYFGAGMGILMLALMGLFIDGDIHELNAIKSWLAVLVNVVATVAFLYRGGGLVQVRPMLALGIGSLVGGYLTARTVTRVRPQIVRAIVVALGLVLSAWCSYRAWFA